jgi:hypothetical protein
LANVHVCSIVDVKEFEVHSDEMKRTPSDPT